MVLRKGLRKSGRADHRLQAGSYNYETDPGVHEGRPYEIHSVLHVAAAGVELAGDEVDLCVA